MRSKYFLFLLFLVLGTSARAGDIWAIHGIDAEGIVLTNPQVIQFTLFMDEHNTPVVTYVENSPEEQKKGKYDIYVGEDHPDHQVRFGAYSFDWITRLLTVSDPADPPPQETEYNKCVFARIKVDSIYPGYSTRPLTDGIFDKKANVKAKERAWASAETGQEHWIQADFAAPVTLQKVMLFWAWDKGAFYESQKIKISYRDASGQVVEVKDTRRTNKVIEKDWKTKDSDLQQAEWTFTPVVTKQLFVKQEPGDGNPKRPNLMWISQIWAY